MIFDGCFIALITTFLVTGLYVLSPLNLMVAFLDPRVVVFILNTVIPFEFVIAV